MQKRGSGLDGPPRGRDSMEQGQSETESPRVMWAPALLRSSKNDPAADK